MTKEQLVRYLQVCIELAEQKGNPDRNDGLAYVRPDLLRQTIALIPADEPGARPIEPFVVKHYASDERPSIKGNGFDGLEIGEERQDAEDFVKWLNERLGVNRGEKP